MNTRTTSLWFVAVLAACQSGSTSTESTETSENPPVEFAEPTPTETPIPVVMSPARAISTAADRLRFAFKAEGDRFHAQHTTHDATIRHGTLTLTPRDRKDDQSITGLPFSVTTRDVFRANASLANKIRSTRLDTTGSISIDRGEAVEQFDNSYDGVEQTWKFPQAPDGTGDLLVRVDVAGYPFITENLSGLHFGAPGKLGVRYGHASWIDADGVVTHIPAHWASDHIEIRVPEEVIVASRFPVALDPTVAAEVAVDTAVAGWTGTGTVRSAIASSGNGFLVVWSDARNGNNDIFGERLDANGTPIDTVGIGIAKTAADEDNATVTFVNGEYLVAWNDATDVRAARVSTAGVVTSIAAPLGAGSAPSLASRGNDALIAFVSGTDIRSALFSGGAFSASQAITSGVITSTPSVGANPAGDYLVTWTQGAVNAADLMGRFVTNGVPGTTITISAAAGDQNEPATAFNGTDFVVVWTTAGADPFGTRVSTAGTVLDTHVEGTATVGGKAIDTQNGRQLQVTLACNTTGTCFTAWSDRRALATVGTDVFGVILDSTLTQVGLEVGVTSGVADEQRVPAAAVQGSDFRLSWEDRRDGGGDTIYSARVNANGALPGGSGANIVRGNNREARPSATASTTNFLVAWSDSRVLPNDIMGERFATGGGRIDANAITISNAARLQNNVRNSFDGTNYVVTWNDNRSGNDDVFAKTMTTAGAVGAEISISAQTGDQITPAVASNSTGTSLIVWQDGRAGANQDIFGVLVVNGAVTVADIPVCTTASTGNQRFPVVAFDSTNNVFVVAWQDDRAGTNEVFAARVSAAGAVLDDCGVRVSPLAKSPAITFGGGESLITWTDLRASPTAIFGARVTTTNNSLNILDANGIAIASGTAQRDQSTVAFVTPLTFVVAWTEGGNIRGQNVTTSGSLSGSSFAIAATADDESRPSLTKSPDGTAAFIAYERAVPSLDARRTFTRRLTFSGTGGKACSSATQCESGFCVDNFCCDTACGGGDLRDCQACSTTKGGSQNGVCTIITQANFTCRDYSGDGFCDIQEKCDGVNPTCPNDVGRRQGLTCNLPGGGTGTCPSNGVIGAPPGAPHVCQ